MADEAEYQRWIDSETKVVEAPANHRDEIRLWLRLLTCTKLIETTIRQRLRAEFGFTLPRFDLLAQLERAESGMVLGEISRRMMVSPGNLTSLIERLVESGHISRTPLPADRRVQVIALTEHGRAEFTRMAERHGDWVGELLENFGFDERDVLMHSLGELKASIYKSLAYSQPDIG